MPSTGISKQKITDPTGLDLSLANVITQAHDKSPITIGMKAQTNKGEGLSARHTSSAFIIDQKTTG